jgi:hypothetical protein
MRKDVSGLVGTLFDSVAGIVASASPDSSELLSKSFEQFGEALAQQLDVEYGPDPEPLAKGLNHVAAFASALSKMDASVEAIKSGQPIFEDDNEPVVASTMAALDRFVGHGVILLKQMVNDTADLPEDEEDLERAEQAGELIKVESEFGGEMLVKSELPEDLAQYLTDPLDLMAEMASMGSAMIDDARDIADVLLQGDPEAIPDDLAKALPLVFDLRKEAPPFARKKRPEEADPDQDEGAEEGDDESDPMASGGAPGRAPGGGGPGMGDDDAGESGDAGAGGPQQDPIETITKLASIIVVIAGSLQEGAAAQGGMQQDAAAGQGADPRNVGLQRGEPILDQPLQKILGGEAEIQVPGLGQMTFAEAIEELNTLRKQVPALNKELGEKGSALNLLKQRYDQIAGQPMRQPGMQKAVPVSKAEDGMPGGVSTEDDMQKLEKLQGSDSEGGAAAKFLIGRVHQGGGTPLVP